MIRRILVGLGGTPYTSAEVRHAVELARAHQADITGLTIVDLARIANVGPVPIGAGAAAAELVEARLETARQGIERASAALREASAAANIRCHGIAQAGDVFGELSGLWRYHDLTVVALRSLFEYGVVHDPEDMLVELVDRGVRPIFAVSREYRPIQRVLITYNGTMESASAMKHFLAIRAWPNAEVRIACFDMPEDRARPLLDDAQNYCQAHGFATDMTWSREDAAKGILHEAEQWAADLIVLGSSTRARILKRVFGDVALHAVKHANVPLFLSQ